jgi:hypothetical protein
VSAITATAVPAPSYSSLLQTIHSLQQENEHRWVTQNDRHTEYLARMRTLNATLAAHTELSSSLVADVSDLRTRTTQKVRYSR